MFSTETLKFVTFVTRFGCRMGFIPFNLHITNKDNSSMKIKRHEGQQWYVWIIRVNIAMFMCILKVILLVDYISKIRHDPGIMDLESIILFEFIIVFLSSYGFLFQLNTILYGDKVEDFFNHVIRFNRQLSKFYKFWINIKL